MCLYNMKMLSFLLGGGRGHTQATLELLGSVNSEYKKISNKTTIETSIIIAMYIASFLVEGPPPHTPKMFFLELLNHKSRVGEKREDLERKQREDRHREKRDKREQS